WSHFGTQAAWGFQVLLDQYGAPGVIVGLGGWAILARRQPLVFGLLASGFVCSFVFAIMYAAATNYFYFIPGHLFWALALGVAGEAALAALTRWRTAHFGFWILDFGLQKSAEADQFATYNAQPTSQHPQFPSGNPKSKIQNLKWL